MRTDRRIVNNRVFLLGLDELYREAIKRHERDELLRSARETAGCAPPVATHRGPSGARTGLRNGRSVRGGFDPRFGMFGYPDGQMPLASGSPALTPTAASPAT